MPERLHGLFIQLAPSQGSPPGIGLQGPVLKVWRITGHALLYKPFTVNGMSQIGPFPSAPQHIMSVTNLLDEKFSRDQYIRPRSQEIFDFIKDRFHEHDVPPAERSRDNILEGDREQDNHMLSCRMMQAYLGSYWYHFSDQLPILHRPTFSSDTTPNLLLLAMMTIGARMSG
ncbi:hypothetical protein J3459_010189 [Metarhizium acridum]|nr:hypothetical protein J3459_010189 [Metarhizium acridum]